ncbi:SAV_2336 N-terminal domain-related protein [Streptomyces sp. NPDC006265]|uniref:SAV_2336 N-terminal domain-related protein n=1 Tax=Streptomyces sp. NPDC006265 TaxID=3156740 RepID=UPI0033A6D114
MYSGCHEGGKPPQSSNSEGAASCGSPWPWHSPRRPGPRGPDRLSLRPVRASPPRRPQGDDVTIRTNTASALNSAVRYRLQLVFDAGPTMPMWRPLLRRLRQSLAQSGSFQNVTVSVLKADGTLRGRQGGGDDRLVTLVLSDCSGPQWHPGAAGERWLRTLRSWARVRPVAVVQPLPEHMWRRSALPATPGRICAPAAGAANSELRFTAYDNPSDTRADSIPVPVLEPASPWLDNWFTLLGGGNEVPAAVAFIPPARPTEGTDFPTGLTAEDLVLRFRATASPEAFRLAGHLAAGVPHLPVMQMVHSSVETAPCASHLAEVILSGMLRAIPGSSGSYAFREGVASVLLRTVPRSSLSRTVALLLQAEPSMRRSLVSAEASRLLG